MSDMLHALAEHPMRCLEITSPPASSGQGLSGAWPTLQALIQVLLHKEQPLEAASFTLVLPKNGQVSLGNAWQLLAEPMGRNDGSS